MKRTRPGKAAAASARERPQAPAVIGGWYRSHNLSCPGMGVLSILVECDPEHGIVWFYPNTPGKRRKIKRGPAAGDEPIRLTFARQPFEDWPDVARFLCHCGPAVQGAGPAKAGRARDPSRGRAACRDPRKRRTP